MWNIFSEQDFSSIKGRINTLTDETQPLWGKMSVDQMLAHSNVSFDMTYSDIYPPLGAFKQFILRLLIKNAVVGPDPYPRNGRTAPEFIVSGNHDFQHEKDKLLSYLQKTHVLGAQHFDGKKYRSFGKLKANEWSVLFMKHLDHHLTQFGV